MSESEAYEAMMSLFHGVWTGAPGASEEKLYELDVQTGMAGREDNIIAQWKKFKFDKILALCLNAFLAEGDDKDAFETEIETRGLTGLYEIFSEQWEADGVRDM